MKHIRLYEDFASDMFKNAHGAVNPDKLIKLNDHIGEDKFDGVKLPSKQVFDTAVNFLDADPDYFFIDSDNTLEPIIYWKGSFYQGFFGGDLSMPLLSMMQMDKRFKMKKSDFEKYTKDNDYAQMFSRTDKKILIPQFIRMYKDIPDDQCYDVFITLYQRSEYGFGMFPEELINDVIPMRTKSPEWKKRMRELKKDMKLNPDGTVTVFRGVTAESAKADRAFSWTLDRKTAEFFRSRFQSIGNIIKKDIDPDEIIDYLKNRGESEVIIIPPAYKHKIK